ncbi:MAG TPA: Gfo/Idh/MocA family oxidoreductase [Candidatus Paceibacterota bacterium]|nr:Gfo/Idh/MocA family oxidoreductase [Verrucomicrobiota bacterium]HRY47329.1 Gfo/Idh/MocA family oxidoreductase [Candidatus Paceibacterota bacterium]HSA02357.1 Gfo/Idh/MocA family oxidoreductase [Candidatus Paceibacterota bacterium]
MTQSHPSSRRDFLKTSSLMTAGAVVASQMPVPLMVHAADSDLLKVAVIGAGGRGTGAALDCVAAGGNIKIIAVADAFEQQAKNAAREISTKCKDKADLPPDRVFWGLDAYLKAVDTGADLVILAGPPGFRPQHYEAAVKAGKHVFMEKPVCICPGGYRKVMAANKVAEEKNLKVVVGLQRHHQSSYLSGIDAIQSGKSGDLSLLRVYWNGGGIWNRPRRPGQTEMQYQVQNWYHFVWLSGDNICEQHVHNLDIGNWVMSVVLNKQGAEWAHPVEANGMGACLTRGYNGKDVQGQIFDAHFIEYSYENGTRMFSQCRHQPNTWNIVNEFYHSSAKPRGANVAGGQGPKLQHNNPYVQEHYVLQQAITQNRKHHEGWHGAISSMTAVLGRTATYSGQVVKWDELVASGPDTFPAELSWESNPPVMPDENGFYPIPTPGKSRAGNRG